MNTPARRRLVATWAMRALVVAAAFLLVRALRDVYLTRDVTPGLEGQLGVRYWEVARASFARGDGFPLWERSNCGGWPFLANPDTAIVSSFVGGLLGIHGDVMSRWVGALSLVIALLGTYAWCRVSLGVGRIAAFWAGALVVSSGFFAFELLYRSHFLPLCLLPWVLTLARLGERDLRAAVGAGAVLALMVLEGGILYPLGFTLVALALCEGPRLFAREAGPRRVLPMLGAALASFVLLAGVKLVPTAIQLARHPRIVREADQLGWAHVATVLGENELLRNLGLAYARDEYRAYVGALAIGMAIAGAGTAIILRPRRPEVPILLLGALLVARGAFSEHAPYRLLTKLPWLDQLAVPGRFLGLAVFGVAAAGAVALDRAIVAVKRPHLVAILVAVAALGIYDPASAARKTQTLYPTQPFLPRPDPEPQPFHVVAGEDLPKKATYPARNLGCASCYALGLGYPAGTALWLGPGPQAKVDGGAGTVTAEVHGDAWILDVDL